MKDIANPNYDEKTLAESSYSLDGTRFEIRGVEETLPSNPGDKYFKIFLSISTHYGHHNATACIQQDFVDAKELKKLGMWLIENAERIESTVDKRADEFNSQQQQ